MEDKICTKCHCAFPKTRAFFYSHDKKGTLRSECISCSKVSRRVKNPFKNRARLNESGDLVKYCSNKKCEHSFRTGSPLPVNAFFKDSRTKDGYYTWCKRCEIARSTYRHRTNASYKLKRNLYSRLYTALKGFNKSAHTEELIGCSIQDLKSYLDSKFEVGMSWKNHGNPGWHVDHIIPCASFDLSDPEQQRKCFHYTNLQPLWAEDNLRKNDKIQEVI